MTEQKARLHSFKLDADVAEGLKAYAKAKYRNNMTHAINEIVREKLKRVKK